MEKEEGFGIAEILLKHAVAAVDIFWPRQQSIPVVKTRRLQPQIRQRQAVLSGNQFRIHQAFAKPQIKLVSGIIVFITQPERDFVQVKHGGGDIVICGKTDIYDAFFQAAGVAGIENAQWLQPDIARQREMAGYGRNDFIMIVRQHLLSSQGGLF